MPVRNGKAITLRHLTMQNSGLPRLPDNMPYADPEDPYADYTEQNLLDFLAGYELPRDPGAEYEYSNLGVGLLGHVLARAAGKDYETLLRERILDPLGMDDTAIALSPAMQARFATPHDPFMRPTKPWALPSLAGAGAMRSTAGDMLKFLAAALHPASPLAPAMAMTLSDRLGEADKQQTALGWMVGHPPSGEIVFHGGGTGGFRSFMVLQPAKSRAVVALTNSALEPSAQDIALHAIMGSPVAKAGPVPEAPPPVTTRQQVTLTTAAARARRGNLPANAANPDRHPAGRRAADGPADRPAAVPDFSRKPAGVLLEGGRRANPLCRAGRCGDRRGVQSGWADGRDRQGGLARRSRLSRWETGRDA